MDTLISMQVFAHVVEARNFSSAARKLKLSQAMVSRHVQNLERRVGARLLNRTSRQFSLTEAGAAYHQRCIALLNDLNQAKAELQSLTRSPKGALRISSSPAFAAAALVAILRDFSRAHPAIDLEIVATTRLAKLVEEQFDVAIRLASESADSSLISRKVATCGFAVCASPGYLAQSGPPMTIDDLKSHRCLAYSNSVGIWTKGVPVLHGAKTESVRVPACMRADDYRLVADSAVADHGIAVLPLFACAEHLRNGRLVELLPAIRIPPIGIYVVYPSRNMLPAKTRTFIDFFVSHFPGGADHDPWRELARR